MVYINKHIAQLCIINPRERVKLPTGGKGVQRQAHESLLQLTDLVKIQSRRL